MRPVKFFALISLSSLSVTNVQGSDDDASRLLGLGIYEHCTSTLVDVLQSIGVGNDIIDSESLSDDPSSAPETSSTVTASKMEPNSPVDSSIVTSSIRMPNFIHIEYPRKYANGSDYDPEYFYQSHVNKIEITYEFTIHAEDKIILSITKITTMELNLAETLLVAAMYFDDADRLSLLIEKGVHRCISDAHKKRLFLRALNNLDGYFGLEAMKVLLENGFCSTNEPQIDTEPGFWYPFTKVFGKPRILKVFLDHDPDFFRKITSLNYVKHMFEYNWINEAERALEAGCDPNIEERGLNALDIALNKAPITLFLDKDGHTVFANSENIDQVQELETKRDRLIEKMKNEHGARISMTKKNYDMCCRKKRYGDAIIVLRSGKITNIDPERSLDAAIRTMDLDLIKAAFDTFLTVLPAHILKSKLLWTKDPNSYSYSVYDLNLVYYIRGRICDRLKELGETEESLNNYKL